MSQEYIEIRGARGTNLTRVIKNTKLTQCSAYFEDLTKG